MKHTTLLNGTLTTLPIEELDDLLREDHNSSNAQNPVIPEAMELPEHEKIARIAFHFSKIMETLGLDLKDDSLSGTPLRVAKMYVKEVFSGLDPKNKPAIKLFENKYQYDQMLVEKDIPFYSFCEHHFVPIIGKAHIAYISSGKVIGLSKLNRVVHYFARRPQVQERLTMQISNELKKILDTDNVAVIIDAAHLCVSSRGVKDINGSTITSAYNGKFRNENTRSEFLNFIY
jgi:GTP cyclohydrolase IA